MGTALVAMSAWLAKPLLLNPVGIDQAHIPTFTFVMIAAESDASQTLKILEGSRIVVDEEDRNIEVRLKTPPVTQLWTYVNGPNQDKYGCPGSRVAEKANRKLPNWFDTVSWSFGDIRNPQTSAFYYAENPSDIRCVLDPHSAGVQIWDNDGAGTLISVVPHVRIAILVQPNVPAKWFDGFCHPLDQEVRLPMGATWRASWPRPDFTLTGSTALRSGECYPGPQTEQVIELEWRGAAVVVNDQNEQSFLGIQSLLAGVALGASAQLFVEIASVALSALFRDDD